MCLLANIIIFRVVFDGLYGKFYKPYDFYEKAIGIKAIKLSREKVKPKPKPKLKSKLSVNTLYLEVAKTLSDEG